MFKRLLKLIVHSIIFLLLTILTQIGGLLYLLSLLLIRKNTPRRKLKRTGVFLLLYGLSTFLIVPALAPLFGREKIKDTPHLEAHSFFYKLMNRNYVRPELHQALHEIAEEFGNHKEGLKLIYLDACFPFIDNFPLLPHLSHHDGKKIDVSLVYQNAEGQWTNKKPSVSGYGVYERAKPGEFNQTSQCKQKGYWQYDFPKYLSLGEINTALEFSKTGTRELAKRIINHPKIGKVFIEPHLKTRLQLGSDKVRFHGCRAVRHDDHIHFQLR